LGITVGVVSAERGADLMKVGAWRVPLMFWNFLRIVFVFELSSSSLGIFAFVSL
jgi:hypothetical protein